MFQLRMNPSFLATLALLLVVPTASQPLVQAILTPLLNIAAQATCSAVLSATNVPKVLFDCKCRASLSRQDGITTSVSCGLKSPLCLVGDTFCGVSTLNATYGYGFGSDLTFGQSCLELDAGLPFVPALNGLEERTNVCITATRDRAMGFESCNATLGIHPCAACSVCSSGVGVMFDCGNVNTTQGTIVDATTGPKVEQCVGIGLIPSLNARPNSILPFGQTNL